MPKSATHPLLVILLGSLLVSCAGSNPGSPTGGGNPATNPGGGAIPGNSAPGSFDVPRAEPGLGQNPANAPQAAPPPAGAPGGQVAFNGDPAGMPFNNPLGEGTHNGGVFFDGIWTYNGGYMEQSLGAKTASLTFRQYTGDAFGTAGGAAPARYRADVTAWVYQPSDQYPNMVGAPLGIIGYAPYFRDQTHYLLAVAKPTTLEVWAVDGFQPGTEWPVTNKLYGRTLATPLTVGAPVAWSVEVDTGAQTAKIVANGEELTTISHPLLTNGGQRVALISNGNYLHFQDFRLYAM